MRRSSEREERLPLLILVALLALVLTLGAAIIVLGFDRGATRVGKHVRNGPVAPADTDDAEARTAAEPAGPLPWLAEGFHVPECRPARRTEPLIHPEARCTASERVTLCLDPGEATYTKVDVSKFDPESILAQAEQIIGYPREEHLLILWHSETTWKELTEERQLREGVAGFYDGAVHLRPYIEARVVRHEIWHAAFSEAVNCAPNSVHEGLATWFMNDPNTDGLIDAILNGFWAPTDLGPALRGESLEEITHAYAQAGARVMAGVEERDVLAVTRWTQWLRDHEGAAPAAAWNAFDPDASDEDLRDYATAVLFELESLDDARALRAAIHAPSDVVCRRARLPAGSLYWLGPEAYDLDCALRSEDTDAAAADHVDGP